MQKRLLFWFILLFAINFSYSQAVIITQATGGEAVCETPLDYSALGDIVITEVADDDIGMSQTGVTIILTCPAGFNFKNVTGSVTYTASMDITAASIVVNTTTATVTFSTNGNPTRMDVMTISGLEVIGTGPPYATGNIFRTGGDAVIAGIVVGVTNFGTLTQSYATTTQTNTSNVPVNSTNMEIIAIPVTMSICNPSNITDFTLSTAGTDNVAINIDYARIFYTGTSSIFATTTEFGSQANPNGVFVINGNQALSSGTNYFWLTYDITAGANPGDIVDGECNSVTFGSAFTPIVTAPPGSRTIGITTIYSNNTGGGDWSAGGSWTGGISPNSNYHAYIYDGDAITLTADAACVDLTIEGGAGGSISVGSYILSISGDVTITPPGNITTTSSSQIVISDLTGSKTQVVLPSGIAILQKFSLNRLSGATSNHNLDLDDNVPGDSIVLVLTNGVLELTGGSKLLMNSIAIQRAISCSDNTFVDGIVSRQINNDGTMHLFPVGDNSLSRKFGIAMSSGAIATHEVQFFNSIPINDCCVSPTFLPGGIIQAYYWHQLKISGGNPQRRIYYEADDFPAYTPAERVSALTLANNDGTPSDVWTKPSSGYTVYDGVSKSGAKGFVQFDGANASNSEYWTFGSTDASITLPVDLVSFSAKILKDGIELSWQTSSEINTDYFCIERSVNPNNFVESGRVPAAGFSNEIRHYNYYDDASGSGTFFYRLKIVDLDGKETYSDIIIAELSENHAVIDVFPNPASSFLMISYSLSENTDVTIEIISTLGALLKTIRINSDTLTGIRKINIEDMIPGVYFLNFRSRLELPPQKILVK